MKKRTLGLLVLLGFFLLADVQTANGQWRGGRRRREPDPATLAERAINRAQNITDRCCVIIANRADDCISEIIPLLFAGEFEKAERRADKYIAKIDRLQRWCVRYVDQSLSFYETMLTYMNEPELAQQVQDAREAIINQVTDAAEDAIYAIYEVFDGGDMAE